MGAWVVSNIHGSERTSGSTANEKGPSTTDEVNGAVPISRIWLMAAIEFCALGALSGPLAVTLSLKVLQIVPQSNKEVGLSIITAVGALCALIANPIFGYASDRTRSAWGRRRPWIVFGVVGGFLSAILIGLSNSIMMLTVAWALSQICYNATLASLSGLLAEQIPDVQRSKASGIFGAAGFLGMIPAMLAATLFAQHVWAIIIVMPLIGLILVPLICLMIPEAHIGRTEAMSSKESMGSLLTSFFFNPLKYRNYSLLWLQRFIMQFGYTIVGTYALYYLLVRMHMQTAEATKLTGMATIIGAVFNFGAAVLVGYLVARSGNYLHAMNLSILFMAVSLLTKAFTDNLGAFWFATILAGFALGMYYAIDLASAMRVLPVGNEGRFLGIFNVAKSLPQSLAPAVAPLFLTIGGKDPIVGSQQNYMSLYIGAAIFVVASFFLALPIRDILSRPQSHRDARSQSDFQAGSGSMDLGVSEVSAPAMQPLVQVTQSVAHDGTGSSAR